jgi:hypothetical protein
LTGAYGLVRKGFYTRKLVVRTKNSFSRSHPRQVLTRSRHPQAITKKMGASDSSVMM